MAQQPQQQQQQQMLIKPEQIDQLPFFDAEKKQRYKAGLQSLWTQLNSHPPGSQGRVEAEGKIRTASMKLMQELATNNRTGRPGSGGGGQALPLQQPPQQAQRPPTQGSTGAPQPVGGQQSQPQPQGNVPQPQPGQQGGSGQQNISPFIKQQLQNLVIHVPLEHRSNASTYKQKFYQMAVQELGRKETAMNMGRRLQPQIQTLTKQGQQVPPQILQQFEAAKNQMQDADSKWTRLKAENEARGRQLAQQGGQTQQPGGQSQNAQMNGAQAQQMQRQGSNNAQPQDMKIEPARTSLSPGMQQSGFQQVQPQQNVNQSAPSQNIQQSLGQQVLPQQPLQPPQTAPQPQHPQNFPQQSHPQQQQAQYPIKSRAPMVNPQMPQGQVPHSQPSQQMPPSGMPNSAPQPQPQPPQSQQQRPHALSQQAAMAQAAATYAQNQQQQQQHGPPNQAYPNQPQIPNGMPFNQQPGSATQPTSGTGFPQPPSSLSTNTTPNNKFPINKAISIDPRIQQPVQAPPSRPTFSHSTVLQQPGIARPPPFTLEGEGDRVLSKRKLDELVRQVTGGAEDGFLTAELEELVLQYVDDFVDDVITSACRLAKNKPSQTLDVKDVQLVLERNYGIRIPGYSLDEARTVKKFQPAPGWQSKMQAIQTAKTLGGVGKGDS